MLKLLLSGYSSVSKANKKNGLSTSDNSNKANAVRAGVIDAIMNKADPTCGAQFWDGTDFLAWGLSSPDGTPQNKFEEYNTITISKSIYNDFLKSQQSKYSMVQLDIQVRIILFLHLYLRIKLIGEMVNLHIVGQKRQELLTA